MVRNIPLTRVLEVVFFWGWSLFVGLVVHFCAWDHYLVLHDSKRKKGLLAGCLNLAFPIKTAGKERSEEFRTFPLGLEQICLSLGEGKEEIGGMKQVPCSWWWHSELPALLLQHMLILPHLQHLPYLWRPVRLHAFCSFPLKTQGYRRSIYEEATTNLKGGNLPRVRFPSCF